MGQCTAVFLLPVLLDPSDRRSADFGKVTGSPTVALAMVILRIRSYCDMMLSTLPIYDDNDDIMMMTVTMTTTTTMTPTTMRPTRTMTMNMNFDLFARYKTSSWT